MDFSLSLLIRLAVMLPLSASEFGLNNIKLNINKGN